MTDEHAQAYDAAIEAVCLAEYATTCAKKLSLALDTAEEGGMSATCAKEAVVAAQDALSALLTAEVYTTAYLQS